MIAKSRLHGIPAGPGLHGFETRQSGDMAKRDLELTHVPCGERICDVEPDDTLSSLVSMAEHHLRACPVLIGEQAQDQ
jgi:hypothetical protein